MNFDLSVDDVGLLAAQLGGFSDRAAHYDGADLVVTDADLQTQIAAILADPGWRDGLALSQAKAVRCAAVNAKRDIAIGGGYQHNFGGTAGIRTLDQRSESDAINWLGLKSLADSLIAAGSGAQAMPIRDAGDETFSASANVVSSAMVAMAEWRSAIMSHSWALKDQIAAAIDEATVAAIDIETGWPT